MSAESEDTRWRFLARQQWDCADCGVRHDGIFDLGISSPDYWNGAETSESGPHAAETHSLTDDLCAAEGKHFFVRGVLSIPLIGSRDECFAYGVWSSLSKTNFDIYRAEYGLAQGHNPGPWFGWFSNALKGYPETRSLKCHVHPQTDGQRPLIELEATDHPLAVEQRTGITFERLIEIYTLHGHRPRTFQGS